MDELLRTVHSEDALQMALAEGRLSEGEHLDFKRELTAGERGTRDLAIDLASFSIGGGAIVVGVTPGRPPALVPTALTWPTRARRADRPPASRSPAAC